jgi:hypothetical protein
MSNAALGYINYVISGTVADSSHAIGFPASNLAGPVALPPWQSANTVKTANIDIDAGASVPWGAIGLFRTNFTTAAGIRVRLGTTLGASDVYDSGSISGGIAVGYGQSIVQIPPGTANAEFCRITIGDSTNPDNHISAGLCFAGPTLTPANNFNYGAGNGWQDDSTVQVTKGGQEYFIQTPQYRTAQMTFGLLSEDEVFSEVMEIDRLASIQSNILLLPNPSSAYLNKQAIFGRITKSDQPTHPDFGIHSKNYAIRERL